MTQRLCGTARGLVLPVVLAVVAALVCTLPVRGADAEPRLFGVVDLHLDLSYQVNYEGKRFDQGSGQASAAHLRAGGVAGVVLPLYIPRDVSPTGPRKIDLEQSYASMVGHVSASPLFRMPGCVSGAGVQTWFAFEGAAPLASSPRDVTRWAARGVRVYGLIHSYDNELGTSSTGRHPRRGGLTKAGEALVRSVHAHGGVVDVSHASDASTRDVVRLALEDGVPVFATHSNARALAAHPRNLTDDQLRAIAKTGGVVGVNFHQPYVARGRPASLDDVVRHVKHIVSVAGIDHVGIGSDFEGDIRPVPELPTARSFPRLAQALLDAGFERDAVAKIFSGNALRVLCRAER